MKRVQTPRMFHWGCVQTRSLLAFHMQIKRVSGQKIFTWVDECITRLVALFDSSQLDQLLKDMVA